MRVGRGLAGSRALARAPGKCATLQQVAKARGPLFDLVSSRGAPREKTRAAAQAGELVHA